MLETYYTVAPSVDRTMMWHVELPPYLFRYVPIYCTFFLQKQGGELYPHLLVSVLH